MVTNLLWLLAMCLFLLLSPQGTGMTTCYSSLCWEGARVRQSNESPHFTIVMVTGQSLWSQQTGEQVVGVKRLSLWAWAALSWA